MYVSIGVERVPTDGTTTTSPWGSATSISITCPPLCGLFLIVQSSRRTSASSGPWQTPELRKHEVRPSRTISTEIRSLAGLPRWLPTSNVSRCKRSGVRLDHRPETASPHRASTSLSKLLTSSSEASCQRAPPGGLMKTRSAFRTCDDTKTTCHHHTREACGRGLGEGRVGPTRHLRALYSSTTPECIKHVPISQPGASRSLTARSIF